jgi:amino acid transporter
LKLIVKYSSKCHRNFNTAAAAVTLIIIIIIIIIIIVTVTKIINMDILIVFPWVCVFCIELDLKNTNNYEILFQNDKLL